MLMNQKQSKQRLRRKVRNSVAKH